MTRRPDGATYRVSTYVRGSSGSARGGSVRGGAAVGAGLVLLALVARGASPGRAASPAAESIFAGVVSADDHVVHVSLESRAG